MRVSKLYKPNEKQDTNPCEEISSDAYSRISEDMGTFTEQMLDTYRNVMAHTGREPQQVIVDRNTYDHLLREAERYRVPYNYDNNTLNIYGVNIETNDNVALNRAYVFNHNDDYRYYTRQDTDWWRNTPNYGDVVA